MDNNLEDLAFVWETAAITDRTAKRVPPSAPPGRWVTIREAHELTGLPLTTLRNWARKRKVPTRTRTEGGGKVRLVDLDAVESRARRIERGEEPPTPVADVEELGEAAMPEGSLLVPLDAWEKMLQQLGNLHEAGQQLATARERAAKAETEVEFLRERLGELRDELREGRPTEASEPVAAPAPEPPPSRPRWQRWLEDWSGRR